MLFFIYSVLNGGKGMAKRGGLLIADTINEFNIYMFDHQC